MKLNIVSDPHEVCGIKYIEVETEYGIHTKLESEVKLRKYLHNKGLTDRQILEVMLLVDSYSFDCKKESEIE